MIMCISGIVAGLGALAGGVSSAVGSKAQAKAAKQAKDTEWNMFLQSREDLAPWREAGRWALGELRDQIESGPGEYTKSPGYEFRLGEGEKALRRNAAARGALGSGALDKALINYGQNYATSDYDRNLRRFYERLNPLMSMSGLGQTTSAQTASLGANTAARIGRMQQDIGDARASGYAGIGRSINNGLGNALFSYQNRGFSNSTTPFLGLGPSDNISPGTDYDYPIGPVRP